MGGGGGLMKLPTAVNSALSAKVKTILRTEMFPDLSGINVEMKSC